MNIEQAAEKFELVIKQLEEKVGKVKGVIYEENAVLIQSLNQETNRSGYREARRFLDSIGIDSWVSGQNNLVIFA